MRFFNFFEWGGGKRTVVAAAALSLTISLAVAALVRSRNNRKHEARWKHVQAQDSAFENRFLKEYDALADDPDAPVPASHANVRETTPQGDVIMTYDADRCAFCYYSDTRSVQFKFLEPVARKYVLEHGCKRLHVDIRKATQEIKATQELKATPTDAPKKDSVFAQFKRYRTQNQQPQQTQSHQSQSHQSQSHQSQQQQTQSSQAPNVQKEVSRYLHCGNLDEFAAVVAAAAQEHDFSVIKPIDYASYKKLSTA